MLEKCYTNGGQKLEYGKSVTYTIKEDNIVYYTLDGVETAFNSTNSGILNYIENGEWKKLGVNESKTITSKYYYFDIAYEYSAEREDIVLTTENKYNILFKNGEEKISDFWIANNMIYLAFLSKNSDLRAYHLLKSGGVYKDKNEIEVGNLGSGGWMSSYNDQTETHKYGIRVVVELENDANLSYDEKIVNGL